MPPRKRKTTTRRKPTTTKKASVKTTPPVVPSGQRLHILSVPFEERAIANVNGAKWDTHLRQTIYVGTQLPYNLTPYQSEDYSWERWIEDETNGYVKPVQTSAMKLTPRKHQLEAIQKISETAKQGYRGFIEADDVGLGKTISSFSGALEVAKQKNAQTILIMCPKSVIPHWRRTIASIGDNGLRIVVINYDQAKKLLSIPESAATATRTRTKNKRISDNGQPLVNWDIILFDESHKLKNQLSQRSKAAARIAKYSENSVKAPYVIWMSATIGQSPPELGYLTPLLTQLTGVNKSSLKDFGQWLEDEDFCVKYNQRFKKWDWGLIPDNATQEQILDIENHKEQDLQRINTLLFKGNKPSIRRLPTNIAGWPEIQRILYPITLDSSEKSLYQQAWNTFRNEMQLAIKTRNPQVGMVVRLRFRQKASLLRVPGIVELITELLENGRQVAVSVEFHETLEAIKESLETLKIPVGEFTGRNTKTREQERLAFQKGHTKVMLFSVEEGISLQQKEPLPDGTLATDVPRATIVADCRYSGLSALQIEGRSHRDGQNAVVYYTFAETTVEEKITQIQVSRISSTKKMSGDDTTSIKELENMLDQMTTDPTIKDGFSKTSETETSPPKNTPNSFQPKLKNQPKQPISREEETLRKALAGGKTTNVKKRNPVKEKQEFETRLRKG